MSEVLGSLLCCGLSMVGLAALVGVILLAIRRHSRPPPAVEALAEALDLRPLRAGLWCGSHDDQPFTMRFQRTRRLASGENTSGLIPAVQLHVPVRRPPLGGECYTKRPWRGSTDFGEAFSWAPLGADHLVATDRAVLVDLLQHTRCAVELTEAQRCTPVREGLQATVGLGLTLPLERASPASIRSTLQALRSAAAALSR